MSIREEVVDALSKKAAEMFKVDISALSADTKFREDLGAKSIDMVKFCALLEDMYEVEVPYMELIKKATFGDAAAFVAQIFGE